MCVFDGVLDMDCHARLLGFWIDVECEFTCGSCGEDDFFWLRVEFPFCGGEEGGHMFGFTVGDFLREEWEDVQ